MRGEPECAHQLVGAIAHGWLWCSRTAVALARTLMLITSTPTENAIAKYVYPFGTW